MPTPHINANKGDFAKVVLMPGDPLRAKWIADNFLVDAKEVTNIRGMLGFTGFSKNGVRLSVMASGMGMPSLAVYATELFDYYDVETIIRVGTAGSYQPHVHVRDIVLAAGSSTDSAMGDQLDLLGGHFSAIPTYEVLEASVNEARKAGVNFHVGNILSADAFYNPDPNYWKRWQRCGTLAVEMESFTLFMIAQIKGKKAGAILTISDSFCEEGKLDAEERQEGLEKMVKIGIATAEKFA